LVGFAVVGVELDNKAYGTECHVDTEPVLGVMLFVLS
jgi:hypothetical protein